MERHLTFETLPKAVSQIWDKLDNIERLLTEKDSSKSINESENLLTVQEAANFLNLAKPTIYSKVHKRELPFMKRGKRLYFSQSELLEYIKEGRRQTATEIKLEVYTYLKKGGKNA
jgi:excisionase family DNA binding protein